LVLCGHQHRQRVEVFDGTTKCVIIPAGAGYEQRIATNPRYVNSYNFVHLDSANECVVYLRRWSDQNNAWLADTETAEQGKLAFSLPKRTLHLPPGAKKAQFLGDLPEDWLHAWYRHVIAGCRHLPLEVIDPKLLVGERDAGAMHLDEIYVELDVFHHSPDHSEQPPEAKQAEQAEKDEKAEKAEQAKKAKKALELLERERRVVLLGDPGSGKTTFVNYLAGALAECALGGPKNLPEKLRGKIPVRLILREAAARIPPHARGGAALLWRVLGKDIAAALGCRDTSRASSALQTLIRKQGALFFLDGLDEVPENLRKTLLDSVQNLADILPDSSRFLITARPYAYADSSARLEKFTVAELAPLDQEQRNRFIERWYEAVRVHTQMNPHTAWHKTQSLQAAVTRPNLAQLAGRPLLLTLMATLHTGRGQLPDDRARLYNDSVELLLGAWQRSRLVHNAKGQPVIGPGMDQVMKIDLTQVRVAMEKLAFQVHERQRLELKETSDSGRSADISKGEVLEAFSDLLDQGGPGSWQLLEYLDRQAGLLIARAEGGPYAFPHRSFQEYLAACRVCDRPDAPHHFRDLVHQDPIWWREVFLLGAGRLCESSAGFLTHLINALLPREAAGAANPADMDWCKAILASEALLEQRILERLKEDDAYVAVYEKVRDWLLRCLEEAPPRTRAEAGDVLGRMGDPRPGTGLDEKGFLDIVWTTLPEGEFWMGSEDGSDDEKPRCQVRLAAFRIARYPITVAQYRAFVTAGAYEEERWWTGPGWAWRTGELDQWKDARYYAWRLEARPKENRNLPINWTEQLHFPNRPVCYISWFEAMAFCHWLSTEMNADIRLPTEAQWERTAAGADGRKFPWGDEPWDEQRANLNESGIHHPTSAGLYPAGNTPEKAADMAGNVWEWCLSLDEKYPYKEEDGRNDSQAKFMRILRGGGYWNDENTARCAYRRGHFPNDCDVYNGFRVVMSPANSDF
ncbi:MAG: SUMF1/EgtB/PvdO family nonheme iron enzyme, partial [Gammaproteobacteria bacterium]|nr:SUMF1/EgtB/PvdO family nonheme iron enzyme [Gammaproteobacteria bacterium]